MAKRYSIKCRLVRRRPERVTLEWIDTRYPTSANDPYTTLMDQCLRGVTPYIDVYKKYLVVGFRNGQQEWVTRGQKI
jgi:hypothetical protein